MFEKEAEEYLMKDGTKAEQILSLMQGKIKVKIKQIPFILAAFQQTFQDGAEFGYNKANEWHKADIPTSPINKVVLGYIKYYNSKQFCLVKWNGEWWYDARTWNDKVKLIAWKEIVLPEEIKEND